MPQSIFIQVGQCGNQVGFQFWQSAIEEYQLHEDGLYEEDVCHFFRPNKPDIRAYGKPFQDCYKARGILIDMEEGVIAEGCRGPLKKLFTKTQILTDVSGSGNNWAVGNRLYGAKYMDDMKDLFRREAEHSDNLQCFLLAFSVGGGTGSGLGTAALEYLHTEFPKVPRLVFAVFPSSIDDVVTSPYNAVLANGKLIEHASVVIPFENQALNEMCRKMTNKTILRSWTKGNSKVGSSKKSAAFDGKQHKPFDDMNSLIVNTILDFTSSSRFQGSLNLDLNDVFINMIPYPRLHYLVSSAAPLLSYQEDSRIDQLFNDLYSENNQFINCSLRRGVVLNNIVLGRGRVSVLDLETNVTRLSNSLKFVPWNDSWKLGLCDVPPVGHSRSLLKLSNTTAICTKFDAMKENFFRMYKKKAHVHHFSDVDSDIKHAFTHAIAELSQLIKDYRELENVKLSNEAPRLNVL